MHGRTSDTVDQYAKVTSSRGTLGYTCDPITCKGENTLATYNNNDMDININYCAVPHTTPSVCHSGSRIDPKNNDRCIKCSKKGHTPTEVVNYQPSSCNATKCKKGYTLANSTCTAAAGAAAGAAISSCGFGSRYIPGQGTGKCIKCSKKGHTPTEVAKYQSINSCYPETCNAGYKHKNSMCVLSSK